MLDNWLKDATWTSKYQSTTIGHRVQSQASNRQSSTHHIQIIGDGSKYSEDVCQAFFALKDHFKLVNISHLGDLKKANEVFPIAVLQEALNFPGKILFLSQDDQYLNTCFRALESLSSDVHLGYINSTLEQLEKENYAGLLKSKNLYNLSCIGYQRHFCSLEQLDFLNNSFINHISYGQIADQIVSAEPIIRPLNGLIMGNSVLAGNPLNEGINRNPNGLSALQACQMAKYFGMSHNLRLININNSGLKKQNTNLVGQMIWYLVEGMALAEEDTTIGKSNQFQEHLVRSDYLHKSLRFWKSTRSNRWWFEIPSESLNEKSNIYPCSYEDYRLATTNELSDFILAQINHDH